jgi:hypothetical protein
MQEKTLYEQCAVRCPMCGQGLNVSPRTMDVHAEFDRKHACLTCRTVSPARLWIVWPA